jgi:hypothetical protein
MCSLFPISPLCDSGMHRRGLVTCFRGY